MNLSQLESIDALLLEVPGLVGLLERRESAFAREVKRWIARVEWVMQAARLPAVAEVASQRASILAAAIRRRRHAWRNDDDSAEIAGNARVTAAGWYAKSSRNRGKAPVPTKCGFRNRAIAGAASGEPSGRGLTITAAQSRLRRPLGATDPHQQFPGI